MSAFAERAVNKIRRVLTGATLRRPFNLNARRACISFTFDDFPATASRTGGAILVEHGLAGTFYLSMGLLGRPSPSGVIAGADDVRLALHDGHEIGCHTFGHLDGTVASPEDFAASIEVNQRAYAEMFPGGRLSNFAYPLDGPGLAVKAAVRHRFRTMRGSGQAPNCGTIDLALLKSYFLDARSANDLRGIQQTITATVATRGWLLFATHDVSETPSRFGCNPSFFRDVVRLAVSSGAFVGSVAAVGDFLELPHQ
jgi:peptidoglycan/xylan/chitin deacetylase (PgdA/CDA1 family)